MLNPFMARMVAAVVEDIDPEKSWSVVEFGNQRFGARGVVKGTEAIATTAEFYEFMGFGTYLALDVNTEMGARIVDLNEPVTSEHVVGRFDLVTNNGTGEHIFDQAMVFKNAHDLCKDGGVMLHVLPFSPWINHGFYNYNPILFRDLAAANDYRIVRTVIGHRNDGAMPLPKIAWSWLYAEKTPAQLLTYMDQMRKRPGATSDDLLIGVALRKVYDAAFRKPLQGKYQKDVASADLREKYAP